MKMQTLTAALALSLAGVACAQVPPPPVAPTAPVAAPAQGLVPPPLGAALPPLPPGCVTPAPAAPPPPQAPVSDVALRNALGLTAAQAAQVREVFTRQAASLQALERQHRELDADTCRDLRKIVGDQGLANWWSLTPPPPPPPPR